MKSPGDRSVHIGLLGLGLLVGVGLGTMSWRCVGVETMSIRFTLLLTIDFVLRVRHANSAL